MNIYIDTGERWHQGLSEFFSNYIKGISLEIPIICPRCGRLLTERTRKVDGRKFIGCTGFSATGCKYTYDLEILVDYQDKSILQPENLFINEEKSGKPSNLYSEKDDKKKKKNFNPKPVLNTEKILQAVNSDLQDINLIAEKLTITDQLDIMYLKNKLKEFERKRYVTKIIVENQEFWKKE